ncbi:hypothetical protein C2G38_1210752 [Gigaspora rosea]|uniref:Uncharacterized protein n=1 Tax=Gigaspora rosea TaxID=44941 RepID=A0A397VCP5_9GLOM|nr:hypothetical protein C2G38_1210752 [Gigaspora rosea]
MNLDSKILYIMIDVFFKHCTLYNWAYILFILDIDLHKNATTSDVCFILLHCIIVAMT